MIIGPNLGGWLVEAFGWKSVFWINIPLGIIVFIVSIFLLRSGKKEGGHMDITGAGLMTGALAAFLYALSEIGNSRQSAAWLLPVLMFAVSIGLIAPAANNACIDLMPSRVATITGVRGMFRGAGGTINITATSLLLSYTSDMTRGFMIVFAGLAAIMFVLAPLIYAMLKGPCEQ